jgi:hypothetical protein
MYNINNSVCQNADWNTLDLLDFPGQLVFVKIMPDKVILIIKSHFWLYLKVKYLKIDQI